MRRILHYIAIAILTLVGPVEAMSSVAGAQEMAQLACQCGCDASSSSACPCHGQPAGLPRSGGPGPSGSSCTPTNSGSTTSQAASATDVKCEAETREGKDLGKRLEPRPWLIEFVGHVTSAAGPQAFTQRSRMTKVHYERSLDRLAMLALFRI